MSQVLIRNHEFVQEEVENFETDSNEAILPEDTRVIRENFTFMTLTESDQDLLFQQNENFSSNFSETDNGDMDMSASSSDVFRPGGPYVFFLIEFCRRTVLTQFQSPYIFQVDAMFLFV